MDNNRLQSKLDRCILLINEVKYLQGKLEEKDRQKDTEHLTWIYDRLINKYHESERMDYMKKLKKIIEERTTHDT